jgi:hypothetical protein
LFFSEHSVVGSTTQERHRGSSNGWYNILQDIEYGMYGNVYPRGFPYSAQMSYNRLSSYITDNVKTYIAVNEGLWVGDPDIDGITWLNHPKIKNSINDGSYTLDDKVWSPINSQNTSVSREAMAAYYFIPMGLGMDRMGDIFQGYFLEKCVKTMGQGIRVGTPLVHHKRNSHNHMQDAMKELPGIVFLEEFLPWLVEVNLDGAGSYSNIYLALSSFIEDHVETMKISDEFKAYWHRVCYCMRKWIDTVQRIGL